MHSLWLSAHTAGTPFGKRDVLAYSLVPGDFSVTMPSTSTLLPNTETFGEAVTVVALGPLPNANMSRSYVSIFAIMLSPINPRPPQSVPRTRPFTLHITSPVVALRQVYGAPRGRGLLSECALCRM